MKGVATCGICLALGLGLSRAAAEERPAVLLGRPSALVEPARRPIADAQLTLVSHRSPAIAVAPDVVRGQCLEAPGLFPLEGVPLLPEEPKAPRAQPAPTRDT